MKTYLCICSVIEYHNYNEVEIFVVAEHEYIAIEITAIILKTTYENIYCHLLEYKNFLSVEEAKALIFLNNQTKRGYLNTSKDKFACNLPDILSYPFVEFKTRKEKIESVNNFI